ncbi:phenylacetic acid degradation protein PaaN [Roseospira navarrensis]|uniref:Phenylacetic acid degradation protein PaaN n=1 Tax=Roseospira navarrensis TaxID=140058 RepID=A0A7X1ZDT3_9PROT|nr:phenylacetic acid degradation protein PaaN [Roseospira navarrensis]MQX36703.1 phenylacetic acid degradation protein PaaN [Roseospira navarrensis]
MRTESGADLFIGTHRETLDRALEAIASRGYWSPYPEMPSPRAYGETAANDGESAFQALLNQPFALNQPGEDGVMIGAERSPFGFDLGVAYPKPERGALLHAAEAALPQWRDAGPLARAAVCLEILARLNAQSFLMAHAVMHTNGQAFMMAFQAGGPHAQDRGLEAVAYAYREQAAIPAEARWEKPQGSKNPPLVVDKTWHLVPRGVAVVIGCATFPTWNGYPGLFASLATGNPVIVKPHPGATLPLALTVKIAREVLADAGFDPNTVLLAVDDPDAPMATDLCLDPRVGVIDFTGSSAFGTWLEDHCRHAQVYAEKAGVNYIVIESTNDFKGLCRNLAFVLSLYAGQMCTTSQNIFIPRDGIQTEDGPKTYDEVCQGLATALDKFLGNTERAVEVLGGICNPATLERIEQARGLGRVVLDSRAVDHPTYPDATVRTPILVALDSTDRAVFEEERFGPIAFLIACDSGAAALDLAAETVAAKGAITGGVYTTNPDLEARAVELALRTGVNLAVNFTAGVYVNQSAAFSDFHATGANPAANAALSDSAFVAGRFRPVCIRRMGG